MGRCPELALCYRPACIVRYSSLEIRDSQNELCRQLISYNIFEPSRRHRNRHTSPLSSYGTMDRLPLAKEILYLKYNYLSRPTHTFGPSTSETHHHE